MARGRALNEFRNEAVTEAASGPRRRTVRTAVPLLFSLAVAAVVLGPMLAPGYPLRVDLVSVPRPVLGLDQLGLGDRLPRAVPLDSVVALLATVWPDAWLTQAAALLTLTLAGWGAARLVALTRGDGLAGLPAQLVAAAVAIWNPFVMEQLAIGHVPHLVAYAALPWIVLGAVRGRWAGAVFAAGLGSVTPGGGVLCLLVVVLTAAAGAGTRRARAAAVTATVVLQLPWLVASLVHPGLAAGGEETAGLTDFSVVAESGLGRVVDVLGLGGMWNQAVVPDSRATILGPAGTVLLLGLALSGALALWRAGGWPRRWTTVVGLGAAVGYLVALLPVLPGGTALLRGLVELVPGAGLLRDGHRWLAAPALLIAVLAGHGTAGLATAVGLRGRAAGGTEADLAGTVTRWATAGLAGALLFATMPDLAYGLGGRLRAAHYPAEWQVVREHLDRQPDDARLLVVPFQPFRQFPWTGPTQVLDPAPRVLPRRTIVSDALTVDGTRLPAEGEAARAVQRLLAETAQSTPEETAQAWGLLLRRLDVGWVLVERQTPGVVPPVPAGFAYVLSTPTLALLRTTGPMPNAPAVATWRVVAVVGAHGLAGVTLVTAAGLALGRRRRHYAAQRSLTVSI
ncbi:hypothetical protein ACIB24_18005 [Spongisporangium articulatum]|uniref:Uncharacterized protein n=1 Tax=Spongisporangium articulatum TaxID=3362603 RepID=A0ABW8ATM8_9ACTN